MHSLKGILSEYLHVMITIPLLSRYKKPKGLDAGTFDTGLEIFSHKVERA